LGVYKRIQDILALGRTARGDAGPETETTGIRAALHETFIQIGDELLI
jgi:hypothetical protein